MKSPALVARIQSLESTIVELREQRPLLEASVAHWQGQYRIAVTMVQEKKSKMAAQAKEIERLRNDIGIAIHCLNQSDSSIARQTAKELKNALGGNHDAIDAGR